MILIPEGSTHFSWNFSLLFGYSLEMTSEKGFSCMLAQHYINNEWFLMKAYTVHITLTHLRCYSWGVVSKRFDLWWHLILNTGKKCTVGERREWTVVFSTLNVQYQSLRCPWAIHQSSICCMGCHTWSWCRIF